MSVKTTRKLIQAYFEAGHDVGPYLADEVVFTNMATGEAYRGKKAVEGMLDYFYSVAFDGQAELQNIVYGKQAASAEFRVKGKHVGEYEGIAATGAEIDVPMVVNYDIEKGKIARGRIYLELPILLKQLGVSMGPGSG